MKIHPKAIARYFEARGATAGRGGMTFRDYSVVFANRTLQVTIYEMPDGKIEQYLVAAGN